MLTAFACATFLGAALVFLLEPMVAKALLPLLGGSPAVWNTCLVFFQGALLLGYLYAHGLSRRLSPARAGPVHGLVLLLPLGLLLWRGVLLPPGWLPPREHSPVPWLLAVLSVSAGLPFLVVSTTGPLLQRWFAATDHPQARDPYFLYAASNAGSLVGLISYPLLIEPALPLAAQARAWTAGYGLFCLLTWACAAWTRLRPAGSLPGQAAAVAAGPPPRRSTVALWVALAAVPSSLVLGVTQFLSTDVAAVPLLWVLPLAVYLLTFVVAFAGVGPAPAVLSRIARVALVTLALGFLIDAREPIGLLVLLHLGGLGLVGLGCHARLAALRPAPDRLTGYYLAVAVGGVLGGSFNALLGPLLFADVREYPLALLAAALLLGAPRRGRPLPALDVLAPLAIVPLTFGLRAATEALGLAEPGGRLLACALPCVLAWLLAERRLGFALALGALLALAQVLPPAAGPGGAPYARLLRMERTFFGVHRLAEDAEGRTRLLLHGSTVHGMERADMPGEPLAYYHRHGPLGDAIRALRGDPRLRRAGFVGLGSGAAAAYAAPGQHWTFFEIDPVVAEMAEHEFGFLRGASGEVDVVLGDGRLALEAQPPGEFGLIVLDAFSSDAIPVHLITLEALELDLSRLQPRGLLLLHISNRYLDLEPVLAAQARALRLVARGWRDADYPPEAQAAGLEPSHWVILARRVADLPPLGRGWRPLRERGLAPWTDSWASVLSALGKD